MFTVTTLKYCLFVLTALGKIYRPPDFCSIDSQKKKVQDNYRFSEFFEQKLRLDPPKKN